jgi:hypothetical protein
MKTSLETHIEATRPPDFAETLRAGGVLRREHRYLEMLYDGLLAAYSEGEWSNVDTQWDRFETALVTHMAMEEKAVFPAFRAVDAKEADALLAEHDELRRLLASVGVLVELHAVPARDAEELIARLRAHGAREEVLLYPWMDDALPVSALSEVQTLRRRAPCSPPAHEH